ncbi:MAG TPA: NUDIX hydrolase [Gaiellaceae bacterium]|nr:NUDIX hydrolase [Gaiellaceae bacterium]
MALVRFCSACGAELPSRPPVTCSSCGTQHWLNPWPCANGIVVDAGRVLLGRRAHAPWYGLWGAPGGFCEFGEHPAETVVREVREEIGCDVEVADYLGTWIDVYADDPAEPDAGVINVAYYCATLTSDSPAHPDPAEVSELAWFAWDELPAELAPPGTLEAVLAAVRSPERSRPR